MVHLVLHKIMNDFALYVLYVLYVALYVVVVQKRGKGGLLKRTFFVWRFSHGSFDCMGL